MSASIGSVLDEFRSLKAPASLDNLAGDWRASFVGPAWLRAVAPKAIAAGGMPGWWGKRFGPGNAAVNLLADASGSNALRPVWPMQAGLSASLLDHAPVAALTYPDGPITTRWLRDELRVRDEHSVLAISLLDLPGLRGVALPFVLARATPGTA